MVQSGSVVTAEFLAELKDMVRKAVVSAIREFEIGRATLPATRRTSPAPVH